MKIRIARYYSTEFLPGKRTWTYNLYLDKRCIGFTFDLRKIFAILLKDCDEVDVKYIYVPFVDNCIGITRMPDEKWEPKKEINSIYKVIYSDWDSIKVGSEILICNDEFRKAVGFIPYHLFSSHYFQIT